MPAHEVKYLGHEVKNLGLMSSKLAFRRPQPKRKKRTKLETNLTTTPPPFQFFERGHFYHSFESITHFDGFEYFSTMSTYLYRWLKFHGVQTTASNTSTRLNFLASICRNFNGRTNHIDVLPLANEPQTPKVEVFGQMGV